MINGVRPEAKLGATQLWSGRELGQAGECRARRAGWELGNDGVAFVFVTHDLLHHSINLRLGLRAESPWSLSFSAAHSLISIVVPCR